MAEKRYESTFLLPTTLADDALAAIVKRFEDAVTSNGGTLIETEKWGIRRLAYEIRKQTSAHYYSLHYTAPSGTNARLDRIYHLDEDVLRWLTLEMPEENFAGRNAMKTRVENVEARKLLKAEEEKGLPS
jgi:small subunit ribosomal protein S6